MELNWFQKILFKLGLLKIVQEQDTWNFGIIDDDTDINLYVSKINPDGSFSVDIGDSDIDIKKVSENIDVISIEDNILTFKFK